MTSVQKFKVILRESNHLSVKLNSSKEFKDKVLKYLSKIFYKRVDLFIAPTKVIKNDLIKNFKVSEKNINILPNPVNIPFILKQSKKNLNFKKKFILSVGRLAYQKNFELLIKSYSLFLEKNDKYDLIILGTGPEKQKLITLIHELKIFNRVHLMGYKLNPYKYIKKCDLLVLSSRWEGFPNVLSQGIVLNKPIVATRCYGSTYEVIKDKGIIIKTNKPKVFAKGMLNALKLKKKNFKVNRSLFNIDEISKEYESIFGGENRN